MKKLTQAEKWRRHRQIFEYGVAHGLSLVEAEFALLREERAARLARMNRCGRAIAPAAAPTSLADRPLRTIPPNAPWMMTE